METIKIEITLNYVDQRNLGYEDPKSGSMSKADFAAMVAGELRIAPSIDLSGVTDDELISELERRGHKLNFIV